MRLLLLLILCSLGCQEPDTSCRTSGDCSEFEQAVCLEGACVCEFDDLDRCLCNTQERCDDIYGAEARHCSDGRCVACLRDEDCGRLGRCSTQGECFEVECELDSDCPIGLCRVERNDCVACEENAHCPNGLVCREDGACVECTDSQQCSAGEVCDSDVRISPDVEIVATNQCGQDCGPRCRPECAGDPDCQLRPECVVDDPGCLPVGCESWTDCELPDTCELRLGPCPDGIACEALAASFLIPIHYACLATPCLYDFECDEKRLCYEGRCLAGCDLDEDCTTAEVCVARAYFDRGACIER